MRMQSFSRRTWLGLAGGLAASGWARARGAQTVRRAAVPDGRRFLHYDVFTDRPLTGNQLAVFLEPQGLATEAMAAMTREMNFSECTFVLPAERAGTDIRLRIFGRGGEMPFAGHPVIGSTFALADEGVIAAGPKEFTFGLGIGPTPVELEWERRPPALRLDDAAAAGLRRLAAGRRPLAAALRLPAEAAVAELPVQEV